MSPSHEERQQLVHLFEKQGSTGARSGDLFYRKQGLADF
jgi:hypothetical protein